MRRRSCQLIANAFGCIGAIWTRRLTELGPSISLWDAAFYLYMMGDDGFEQWMGTEFHLVLMLRYPDETTFLLAERMPYLANA